MVLEDIDRTIDELKVEVRAPSSSNEGAPSPEVRAIIDAYETMRTELHLPEPNLEMLQGLLREVVTHRNAIAQQLIEAFSAGRVITPFGSGDATKKFTLVFNALAQEIVQIAERRTRELNQASRLSATVDNTSMPEEDMPMTSPTREEVDAKLQAMEARMDGRVASIEAKIDGLTNLLSERFRSMDERMSRIESDSRETQSAVSGLKSTMILTAVSTVVAIVLGVAAFNATVLSNMVASFESGKNTAAAQAEVKKQSEDTAALLKQLQSQFPPTTRPSQQK